MLQVKHGDRMNQKIVLWPNCSSEEREFHLDNLVQILYRAMCEHEAKSQAIAQLDESTLKGESAEVVNVTIAKPTAKKVIKK